MSEIAAVFSIKKSVLQCDHERWSCSAEGLSLIRCVYQNAATKVAAFVSEHGEKALLSLESYPNYFRLVHELSKVPQIDERLECMIFERTFEEKLDHCNDSLRRVGRALDLIISKSDLLHDFFSIVREVGN